MMISSMVPTREGENPLLIKCGVKERYYCVVWAELASYYNSVN